MNSFITMMVAWLSDLSAQTEDLIVYINGILWSEYFLVPLLLIAGLFFSIYFGFPQFRLFPDMIKSLLSKSDKESENSISSFEAFAVGLASRVGTGNISGVAVAIIMGGPGAIFWMWVVALLGASSAFVESSLAQLFKIEDDETKYRGGPAYYIRDGLNSKFFGGMFSVFLIIAFGLAFNSVQSNTITISMINTFAPSVEKILILKVVIGLVLVVLTSLVLYAGAKVLVKVTTYLVPIMAFIYIILALLVVVFNFGLVDDVFRVIIKDALSARASLVGISVGMIWGVKRGLFSNEAGMGSAPNAAASADVGHPITQGLIQALGVFIDTIIVCSATAFIILTSGTLTQGMIGDASLNGITVTSDAMSSVLGTISLIFLTIAIFFFGFSSILGNYYYTQTNIEFLTKNKYAVPVFKGFVVFMVFMGAISQPTIVWQFADVTMALMAVLNIIAIVLLVKYVKILLKDYEQLKKDKKPLIFDSSKYPETKKFKLWSKKD